MNPTDIFFYEAFEEEQKAIAGHLPPGLHAQYTWRTIAESGHVTPPSTFISVRTQSAIPQDWPGKLRGVLTRSTGYDHLEPVAGAVPCGFLPSYCASAVAEHAALMWMALLRKLPLQLSQFRSFGRDGLTGRETAGKTLLIVGVGRIGHAIHELAERLGLNVLGVDIDEKHADVQYVDIDEGLPQADIVVCAMSLTDANRYYFTADRLNRVKQGAVFVNIARGEFVSPIDLLNGYKSGRWGGIALDVFDEERELACALRAGDRPGTEVARAIMELADLPNVIMTPHNAFNSMEALARKAGQSAQQVQLFLETGRFDWRVPS